jgi:hypothetical protein
MVKMPKTEREWLERNGHIVTDDWETDDVKISIRFNAAREEYERLKLEPYWHPLRYTEEILPDLLYCVVLNISMVEAFPDRYINMDDLDAMFDGDDEDEEDDEEYKG